MQDSVRDAFMVAEKLLGYDMNTVKEEEIKACTDNNSTYTLQTIWDKSPNPDLD